MALDRLIGRLNQQRFGVTSVFVRLLVILEWFFQQQSTRVKLVRNHCKTEYFEMIDSMGF